MLYCPNFFGMCCRSEWQERMYIYKWHEVDQTKHEIFCVHIICNEIQVKVNLEITTFFFYLRFPYCPNFFWFGVVHTHSSEHTPGAVGSHIDAAPGEQLGVWCLAQGHLSHGIEGGRVRWLVTPKSKWLDNWDCLGFWGIKKWVNFYHCRVVVSKNC